MSLLELFIVAVGLAMDAFAVSVCKGLSIKEIKASHMLKAGLWFGFFQAAMPVAGYMLGNLFTDKFDKYDHWIAFILLALIGFNMIRETFGDEEEQNDKMDAKTMLILAIATSIDAMAVGVSFAFLKVSIIWSALFIGVVTFVISALGVILGNRFNNRFNKKAEITGGVILIIIGLKILITGLI